MPVSQLKEKILAALEKDERTQEHTFEIIVAGGLVTLRGETTSRQAHQAAVEITRKQADVIQVIDDIHVVRQPDKRLSPIPNPEMIKQQPNQ